MREIHFIRANSMSCENAGKIIATLEIECHQSDLKVLL